MTLTPMLYTAGVSIETNHDEGTGTLGGFARDKDGKPVLVSCSHVLFPGFRVIDNLRVFSPDYRSTCCGGEPIGRPVYDRNRKARSDDEGGWVGGYQDGTWTGGFTSTSAKIGGAMGATKTGHASKTDCAIARLDPGIRFQNVWQVQQGTSVVTIPIKGAVAEGLGVGKGPKPGTKPDPGQYVRVYSANSGRIMYGTMLSTPPADIHHFDDPDQIIYRWGISDTGDAGMGNKTSVNQFLILPRPTPVEGQSLADSYRTGEKLGFEDGDSGSWVINYQNLVIGMIIRKGDPERILKLNRGEMEFRDVGGIGIATPIQEVLDLLNISIPAADGGWSGTAPSAGTPREQVLGSGSAALARRQGVERLREQLSDSVRGRILLGKISQHRREVRRLLTSVRPIAAAWRALNGAGFYHHCVRSVQEPGHRIPTSINGVTRERLVETMLPLVAEYASPALRKDIQRYGSWVASALLPITGINDVPAALASPGSRR